MARTLISPILVATLSLTFATKFIASQTQTQDTTAPAEAKSTIRGIVLNSVDGKPVPHAEIWIVQPHRSTLTDENGRFEVLGVAHGTVAISTDKPGFFQVDNQNGRSSYREINLEAQDIQLTFSLMPEAVIAGRIRNENGEPVIGMNLYVLQRVLKNGRNVWETVHQATTNNEGEYRLDFLRPGSYILRTDTMSAPDDVRPNLRHRTQQGGYGYGAEYYPNASDVEGAKPLVLTAGQHATADFTLAIKDFQLITVPYVADLVGSEGIAETHLIGPDGEERVAVTRDKDRNLLRVIAPRGSHTFTFAFWPNESPEGATSPWKDGSIKPLYGMTEITVADQPVTLSPVPLQRPSSIPIHVRTEFSKEDWFNATQQSFGGVALPLDVVFELVPRDVGAAQQVGWRWGDAEQNPAFKDVIPGRYTVESVPVAGSYIAALACGGIDLMRNPLIVGSSESPCSIEAVLRDDVASVEIGLTVEGLAAMTAAGKLTASPRLFSLDDPAKPAPRADIYFKGPRGGFFSVIPGTYLAIISDEGMPIVSPPPLAYRDPETLKRLLPCGRVITVRAREHAKVLVDWCTNPRSGFPRE